jgi:S1-C subfamily serine protease
VAKSKASSSTVAASKVDPGLVDVNTTLGYEGEAAAGTGMVLTSSGTMLTNNHVIDGATAISVTDVGNHNTHAASVVGYDLSADVALLQLCGGSGLATVPFGNSAALRVGTR